MKIKSRFLLFQSFLTVLFYFSPAQYSHIPSCNLHKKKRKEPEKSSNNKLLMYRIIIKIGEKFHHLINFGFDKLGTNS